MHMPIRDLRISESSREAARRKYLGTFSHKATIRKLADPRYLGTALG